MNTKIIVRCKHRKTPGDGGIVDGCGWQGEIDLTEHQAPVCPGCGSLHLRPVDLDPLLTTVARAELDSLANGYWILKWRYLDNLMTTSGLEASEQDRLAVIDRDPFWKQACAALLPGMRAGAMTSKTVGDALCRMPGNWQLLPLDLCPHCGGLLHFGPCAQPMTPCKACGWALHVPSDGKCLRCGTAGPHGAPNTAALEAMLDWVEAELQLLDDLAQHEPDAAVGIGDVLSGLRDKRKL